MTMETVESMSIGRRSLLKSSAALAGLWPLPSVSGAVGLKGDAQNAESFAPTQGVELTRHGNIALVVLNCPSEGNFLNKNHYAELLAAFRTIDEDASVHSTVLAGRGAHFSMGIDSTPSQIGEMLASEGGGRESNGLSTKPVVAVLQGQTVGFGAALPLCADIRIATADAVFLWPDPSHANVLRARLIDEIGRANAQRYLLTGHSFDAREAWRLGLLQDIVADPAEGFEKAMAVAESIAQRTVDTRNLA
jgi:enoyl-CoA hydratase/carnithine racemase